MDWAAQAIDALWRHAWVVVPVGGLTLLACRLLPARPATRHGLWVVVLAWFVMPVMLPEWPVMLPGWPLGNAAGESLPEISSDHDGTAPPAASAKGRAAPTATPAATTRDSVGASGDPVPDLSSPAESPREAVDVFAASDPCATLAEPPRDPVTLVARRGAQNSEGDEPTALNVAERNAPWPQPAGEPAASAGRHVRSLSRAPSALPLAAGASGHPTNARVTSFDETSRPAADDQPREVRGGSWLQWLAALRGVRDALLAIPAIPAGVWLGGMGVVLAWHLAGLWLFARRLSHAQPAPRWAQREVREVARQVGLRREPEALMVSARISPLVLVGPAVRLVLPAGLWGELDATGRRAILCHELAHMRRGDHWVRWAEILVSSACWWHPLVWWVRRRIGDEADLSCDAWVTWLMPQDRRAYAEALLRTRQYVSPDGGLCRSVGLGVTSAGAKRLARRLSMVMTKSNRPRPSAAGLGLACGVMLAGWAVTPVLACPPEEAPASGSEKGALTRVTPPALKQTEPAKHSAFGPIQPVLLTVASTSQSDDATDEQARFERLERQVRELTEELRRLSRDMPRGERRGVRDGGLIYGPRGPRAASPPVASAPPAPPGRPMAPMPPTPRILSLDSADAADDVEVIAYRLPTGKLRALTALMARDDVPVLMRPGDEAIEVYGTPQQHEIFKAFVDLIHPRGAAPRDGAPDAGRGAGDAAEAARAREHAPGRAARGWDVYAGPRSRRAAARAARHMDAGAMRDAQRELERHVHQFEARAEDLARQAEEARARLDGPNGRSRQRELSAQARALEAEAQALEAQARQLERQAAQMQRQAERRAAQSPEPPQPPTPPEPNEPLEPGAPVEPVDSDDSTRRGVK